MAILTPSQLQAASNATYFNNVSGSITPASVRTLNTDWISSSILTSQTSSMSVATASFTLTSSYALNFNPGATASYAVFAQNAANAATADTATFATTAGAANSAISASHVDEAMVTASIAGSTLTFTKGDGTTFNLLISQTGSVASASYAAFAQTAGTADTATVATSSISSSYAVSASSAVSSNTAISSSFATNANTATSASHALFADTAASSTTATTASYALNADLLDNFTSTAFVFTSSFSAFSSSVSTRFGLAPTLAGNNTFTGNNIFGNVTASNALITSATVENLTVIYETSSIIYSSGSNQFGDATNDVQTLWGTVDIKSGPVLVTGSVNASGNIIAPNFIGTASLATNATTAATASSVNTLTQDVLISGSVRVVPTSLQATAYAYGINEISDATATEGNLIISRGSTSATFTGSVLVSGSTNIALLTVGAANNLIANGAAAGFRGSNSFVTVAPTVTGSNGTGYARELPTFTSAVVNSIPTINDNRPAGTAGTPLTLNSVGLNSTLTFTTSTGSATIANANIAGQSNNITISGTNGTNKSITALNLFGNANTLTIESPSAAASISGVLVGGNSNGISISGSNTTLQGAAVLGYQLLVTGSATGTTNYGSLFAGRWNASDNTSLSKETAFAVGTGTSAAARRTSFHVSASGLTTVSNNLVVTGSVNGNVVSSSIASNTSSLDFSQGNFFTSLVESNTFFNITNPKAGQTVNLLLTTNGDATASFSSNVKQVSGSSYLPTAGTSKNDILTFISWDGTSVYLANVKNLI
jgi:hypothetical protein